MQPVNNFCPSCGQQLATNVRFCPVCGREVPVAVAPPPVMQQPYAPQQPMMQQPYAPQQPLGYAAMTPQQERNWAMYCHLASLIGWILPFGDLIATLIIWSNKKDQSAFVNDHGKEAMNYQITFYIFATIFALLSCVYIGIPFLIALGVFDIVVMILASVKASNGEYYRYPLTIRFIK